MDKSPRRWYSAEAQGLMEWRPTEIARYQQERISGIGTVLAVALRSNVPSRPKVVRWKGLCLGLLDLWGRVSMEDPGVYEFDPEDATDDQLLTGKDLDPHWYATTMIAQATAQATRAITAGYDSSAPKRILNQMGFYFTREIEEVERIFGI